jgi:hypothetical protein
MEGHGYRRGSRICDIDFSLSGSQRQDLIACGDRSGCAIGVRKSIDARSASFFVIMAPELIRRIAVTGSGDTGQNPESHHANNADANPSWRNMKQMRSDRKPHDQDDVADHIHAK